MLELTFHKYPEEKPEKEGQYLVIYKWVGHFSKNTYKDYTLCYFEHGAFDLSPVDRATVVEWAKLPEIEE